MRLKIFVTLMLKRLTEFRTYYEAHKDDPAWPDEMDLSDWVEQFMFFCSHHSGDNAE